MKARVTVYDDSTKQEYSGVFEAETFKGLVEQAKEFYVRELNTAAEAIKIRGVANA